MATGQMKGGGRGLVKRGYGGIDAETKTTSLINSLNATYEKERNALGEDPSYESIGSLNESYNKRLLSIVGSNQSGLRDPRRVYEYFERPSTREILRALRKAR